MPMPYLAVIRGFTQQRDHAPAEGICYGLALRSNYFRATVYNKVMTLDQLEGSLMDPCSNCRELIRLFRGNLRNFLATLGRLDRICACG